jgi:hypothetical protein
VDGCEGSPSRAQYLPGGERDSREVMSDGRLPAYNEEAGEMMREAWQRAQARAKQI